MTFDLESDVVVVGSGIAGVSAALAAHALGLRPVLLEKSDLLGGGTTYSYGLIWMPRTHLARAAGIDDDLEDVLSYARFMGAGYEDGDRLLTFYQRGPEAIEFFTRCGIDLRLSKSIKDMYLGKVPGATAFGRTLEHNLISGFALGKWRDKVLAPPIIPHRIMVEEFVAWGGIHTEASWEVRLMEERRERDIRGIGYGLISGFVRELVRRGVDMRLQTTVDSLINEGGRIAGVRLESGARLGARYGVVIATGGYESNAALVKNYEGLPEWHSMFPDSLTGDGLIMSAEQGASVHRIHNTFRLHVGIVVPGGGRDGSDAFNDADIVELCSPHTLVVNRFGKRFANEAFFQSLGGQLRRFDGASHSYLNLPCFLIFDQQYADKFSFCGKPAGTAIPHWVQRADALADLGAKLGIDGRELARTAERFNALVARGRDDDFGREAGKWSFAEDASGAALARLGTVSKPPFYGVRLHPSSPASAGVETDTRGRVLQVRRRPIPGLYASGNVSAHTEIGVGYQAGLSIASAMVFSYLAVRDMIDNRKRDG